ncbi:MAG: CHAT domain-containing tetratricopeptide repeat protein [Cyanobacteria bacterium P01_F01_bin.150]
MNSSQLRRYFKVVALVITFAACQPLFARKAQAQTVYVATEELEIPQRNHCGELELVLLHGRGLRQYQQGQYREALSTFERYQQITRRPCRSNQEQNLVALNRLARVYESLGQYDQALTILEQAQGIIQTFEDNDQKRFLQGITLNNLGLVFVKVGDYQLALASFQEALELHIEGSALADQGTSYSGIGLAHFRLENYAKSLTAYQKAHTILAQESAIGAAIVLNGVGNAQAKLKQYDAAMHSFDQALAIFQSLEAQALAGLTRSDRGSVLISMGQLNRAEVALRQAADLLDSVRDSLDDASQISIFETQASAYRRLQLALIEQGKIEAALEVSERGRARAFVSQLSQQLRQQAVMEPSPDIEAMRSIAKSQNATLVNYSIGRTVDGNFGLFIWVLQPTGELIFKQVALDADDPDALSKITTLAQLDTGLYRGIGRRIVGDDTTESTNLLADVRAAMVVGRGLRGVELIPDPDAQIESDLQELYQLLIQPIHHLLPTDPDQLVTFIPQGGLFLVPFPALQDEDGTYLIENHTLSTVPSIQVLGLTATLQAERRSHSPNLTPSLPSQSLHRTMVVGNPTMPVLSNLRLPPLPGAEQEASQIAALLQTQPLIGSNATESTIKAQMPTARLIHLATHGLLEYGSPEDSGVRDLPGAIALTPDDQNDGLLTSAEILDLDLSAELVVLSACDTGRGRITGDGVVGLSRSLIVAGTPSVVVSLWSVPDAPTAELMVEFYQQLQHTSNKAKALRQAMLKILPNYPKPKDWAAFTIIGAVE